MAHCRHWHPVTQRHADGTEYTRQMLYWECRGQQYYAGQIGTAIPLLTSSSAAHPHNLRLLEGVRIRCVRNGLGRSLFPPHSAQEELMQLYVLNDS